MNKLKSRKFWVAIAAMLAGIGSTIAGYATASEIVASVGIICTALSAGIYAGSEAVVDRAALESNSTATYKNVTATATDKATVQAAFATDEEETE